ncbi:MAG: hypothetical protein JRH18_23810 [Deltaproteobacteria bacterium]|nr:hypothetical protein [Deltaproteobacteria bacterium]
MRKTKNLEKKRVSISTRKIHQQSSVKFGPQAAMVACCNLGLFEQIAIIRRIETRFTFTGNF